NWYVLVVKPPVTVSTADAYARLDRYPRPARARAGSVTLRALAALQRGDFAAAEACLTNDFHDVIAPATPEIAFTIDALLAAGGTNALLCGSGSAVFSLARDASTIHAIAANLTLPEAYLRFETAFASTPAWRGP
ncbi:MAG: 4-(cytidine 5'-diphospho)-2-C-methyl-D-erythritol kinase, partial [Vulcanimicrobiaceae bacterium]